MAVELDEEVRLPLRGDGFAQVVARGAQGEGIGDFQSRWQETAVEDDLHSVSGGGEGGEPGGKHGTLRRMGDEAQGGFGDEAEHALAADHETDEVEAGFVFVAATAGAEDIARGEHRLKSEHVVAGDAVFEAAGTAGIGGDVAAEAALFEGSGIGRVEPAFFTGCGLQMGGDDTGLHDRDAVVGVEFEDLIQGHQVERDAAMQRHRPADIPDPRPLRCHGDAVGIGVAQDF